MYVSSTFLEDISCVAPRGQRTEMYVSSTFLEDISCVAPIFVDKESEHELRKRKLSSMPSPMRESREQVARRLQYCDL